MVLPWTPRSSTARGRLRGWTAGPWCSCTCGPATPRRSGGGGRDAVRATQVKGRRGPSHPPTHLCEAEEESDSAQEPQNLRRVSLHDAGTGGAGGRAAEARLEDGRRTRTGLDGPLGRGGNEDPTHRGAGAVGGEAGEAAAVQALLHVPLSGLRPVPAHLQQVVLEKQRRLPR